MFAVHPDRRRLSDSFKMATGSTSYRRVMDIRLESAVIEIVSRNLDRSIAFYRLLGLEVPDADGPHVEVALPGGNKLMFDTEETIAGMHPGWTPPSSQGRVTIGFGVGSPESVDAVFDRVMGEGHPGPLAPFDAPWGQRYATVTDPDGTSVDLFAPLSS
jgi:uncharacterized glyoxalase superfamily protein PhnB